MNFNVAYYFGLGSGIVFAGACVMDYELYRGLAITGVGLAILIYNLVKVIRETRNGTL